MAAHEKSSGLLLKNVEKAIAEGASPRILEEIAAQCIDHIKNIVADKSKSPPERYLSVCQFALLQFPANEKYRSLTRCPVRYVYM